MGTKENPGRFDCYAKASPDEPIFILRAKDPSAAGLVNAWRFLQAGQVDWAIAELRQAQRDMKAAGHIELPLVNDKLQEAAGCSTSMRNWRTGNVAEPPPVPGPIGWRRVCRWFHCMCHLHRPTDMTKRTANGFQLVIGCECGKVWL